MCQLLLGDSFCYFEVRSLSRENRYNTGEAIHSSMRSANPLVNLEDDQKFDSDVLKRLAKVVEMLQNLED